MTPTAYNQFLQQPVTLAAILPIAVMLVLLAFALWSFARAIRTTGPRAKDIRTPLLAKFGLGDLPQPWAAFGVMLWAGLLLALALGAVATILSVPGALTAATTAPEDATLRWTLLTLTALTGALGAVVALPFTLIRIRQTQRQTDLQEEALFNDKINAAATDLAAQRQVTRVIKDKDKDEIETILTEWEDDLVTRAAAIDRLEILAQEAMKKGDVAPAQRVARMLSIYVQELSRDPALAAKPVPEYESGAQMQEWAETLRPARSDMERAVQSLGRINPDDADVREAFDPKNIDLRRCNLQGFDLRGDQRCSLNFQGTQLQDAAMQGASLWHARMRGANLEWAKLHGAVLRGVDLQGASLIGAQMQSAYLEFCQMHGADLSMAEMQDTYLTDVTLRGAAIKDVGPTTMKLLKAHPDWDQIFHPYDRENFIENWRAFAADLDPNITIASDYNCSK